MNNVMSWHTIGISALYAYFFSSPEGLSQLEAEKRRFSNQSAGDEYKQLLLHTLLGLPLIYLIGIFLVAFGAFANGYMYAGGLGIAVGIIYTIVFLREARQRVNWTITLTNLNQEKVTVYRDGEPKMHMPGDLVLGDVVELKPNMILPVTVRLIEAEHLFIANDAHSKAIQKEAINHPKEKSVVTKILFPEKEWRETNPINMALAGSLIIKGAGKGIVVDIPADTNTWWLAEKFHMEPLFSWSSAQYYPLAFASMLVVILLILSSLALDDKSHGFFDIILGSISFALLVFPVTAILLNIHQANIQIQNLLRKHIAVRNTKVFTSLLDTSLVVADADYLLQEHIAVEEKNYLHNLSAQGLHFIMLTTKSKEWLVHKLKEYNFINPEIMTHQQFKMHSDRQIENMIQKNCFFVELTAEDKQRLFQLLKINNKRFILIGDTSEDEMVIPNELRLLLSRQATSTLMRNAADILVLSNNVKEFLHTLASLQQKTAKTAQNTALLKTAHYFCATGIILAFLIGGGVTEVVAISLAILLILWNVLSIPAA